MLAINDLTRFMLRATGAIETNDEGEEVLIGLTQAESNFFIACGQKNPSERELDEIFVFNQLKHLHLKARLRGNPEIRE